uniref:Putative secreted protein n=1 Tax=Ixodes ricinus TaxID=34613 RepID=A0A6B0UAP4_IXORI
MRSSGISAGAPPLVLSTSLSARSLVRCRSSCTASRFMPHDRHFWYRQYWHRLRCRLSMMQLRSSRHAYVRSLRTVRLKKPLQPSQLYTP